MRASLTAHSFIPAKRPWHRFGVNLLLYYEDGANACSLRFDPRRFGPTTDTQFGHDGYCHRPSLRTRPSCALTLFFPIGKSCPNPATAFSASARRQRDRQPKDKVSKQTSVLKRQSPCVVVKSILGSALGLLGRQICLNSPLSALPKQSPATSDILVRPHPFYTSKCSANSPSPSSSRSVRRYSLPFLGTAPGADEYALFFSGHRSLGRTRPPVGRGPPPPRNRMCPLRLRHDDSDWSAFSAGARTIRRYFRGGPPAGARA